MAIVEHVYADQPGSYLGKYSERLRLSKKGETLQEAPLMHLKSVTIANRGVTLSADAIAACTQHNIPIIMMHGDGEVYASVYSSALVGTVRTRREQLRAYDDLRGFHLALAFSMGKLINQALTLRYWARNRQESHPKIAETLRQTAQQIDDIAQQVQQEAPAPLDSIRDRLMGLEGHAATLYWHAANLLVPADYRWTGRITHGAKDPINSLLNYGYGILYSEVENACVMAGLDPFGGFLHADRPGSPSLTFDLIEEFRQLVVDRVVIGLAARNYSIEQDKEGRLATSTRRDYAQKVLGQLDGKARYQGERQAVRAILQSQARRMVSYLRGEAPDYIPYRWED